ncbi:MAG TPA: type II toxin-antitoxin system death-on-curing family toxin [Vicinamibacterales bacterium]|nr:type II toxin-antitoxin system death-on-curing family toxin [Vicinamibacterales bacterium]
MLLSGSPSGDIIAFGAIYLTLDQVVEYHKMALAVGGGSEGFRSYEGLASAVGQPRATFGGDDLYPTIPHKAASYAFGIAEGQPFLDGNKRTAAIAMLAFLDLNAYEFHQTDDEIEKMFVDLGDEAGGVDQDRFFSWVCEHAMPKPAGEC